MEGLGLDSSTGNPLVNMDRLAEQEQRHALFIVS